MPFGRYVTAWSQAPQRVPLAQSFGYASHMLNVTLATLLVAALSAQTRPASASDVAWLAGCWDLQRGQRHTVEHWMAPEGGMLLGMSRTVADGKAIEHEFAIIRERNGGLEYVARPSGQAEAIFSASRIEPREVAFENPTHDFPQRIIYRKSSDGELVARIEGMIDGKARSVDFAYRAATCGS